MNPRNLVENDARRGERRQRLSGEGGASPSSSTRAILGWIIGVAALLLAGYALLFLIGIAVSG